MSSDECVSGLHKLVRSEKSKWNCLFCFEVFFLIQRFSLKMQSDPAFTVFPVDLFE